MPSFEPSWAGAGAGGETTTVFYVDWDSETMWIQDGDSLWSDGSTASTRSVSNAISHNTRSVLAISSIVTPNGDTLDNYKIEAIEAQIRLNGIWTRNTHMFSTTAGGTTASIVDATSIVVQTGDSASFGVGNRAVTDGNGSGYAVGGVSSAYARVRIACSKQVEV